MTSPQTAFWQDFEVAKIIIEDVAAGRRLMGMISSDTGFGKTFLSKRAMRKRMPPCVFYEFNPKDANALVSLLWRMQSGAILDKGRRIEVGLLDDADEAYPVDLGRHYI